jgi:hypothetical protein
MLTTPFLSHNIMAACIFGYRRSPPTASVREGCIVALKRLQAEQQLTELEVAARQQLLLVPKPDTSLCGRYAQDVLLLRPWLRVRLVYVCAWTIVQLVLVDHTTLVNG